MLGMGAFRNDSAEINNTADTGRRRSSGKIAGRRKIELAEVPATGHGMHQIIGDADAGQSPRQGFRLQRIGFDYLNALPASRFKRCTPPRRSPQHSPFGQQSRHKVRADVAAGTKYQR